MKASGPQTVEAMETLSIGGQRRMWPSMFCKKVSQSSSNNPNEKPGSGVCQNSGFCS